jgi:hypothetical protein
MKHLRLIAVWLLMLTLPLQGLAALMPSVRCADSPPAHAVDSQQGQHHAAPQMHDHPAEHQQQDNDQPDQPNGHSCCHQVFSGVPSAAIPGMPASPSTVTPRVSLLTTLYIPELPQRPPQA